MNIMEKKSVMFAWRNPYRKVRIFFVFLGYFYILREYRAAAGVDDRLSPQSSFRIGFEAKFLKLFLELPIIFTTFVSASKKE